MTKHLFEDLVVLDIASFIAGPVATTFLADFGAKVIKVEAPAGDGLRSLWNGPGMPASTCGVPRSAAISGTVR